MITRREWIAAALAATSTPLALAQSFPSREVRFLVPYPAGGITDLLARKTAEMLSARWKQSVVVDNRPGANGNLAAQMAAKAPADGYTIYMGFLGTHAANASLYPNLGFDPVGDFTPVSLLANAPMVLTVHPKTPAKTVKELIAYARANPGKLNFGSSGQASASHLTLELFKSIAKVDIQHVPYKGTGALMTDLLAGRIDGYFDVPITSYQHVQEGRRRALVVADKQRSARLPDVPTASEAGIPEFLFTTWLGVLAPAGLPPPVLAQMSRDIAAIQDDPEFAAWCASRGMNTLRSTPEQFKAFLASETAKFAKVIKEANIRIQ